MATIYILYVTYLLKTILFEGKYAFIRLLVKYFFLFGYQGFEKRYLKSFNETMGTLTFH